MLVKFKKVFFRNHDPNCIKCALGPMLILSSCFGGFSCTYKCEHSKTTGISQFEVKKLLILVALAITIFNVTSTCFLIKAIIAHPGNKLLVLMLLSELLHSINGITLNVFNVFSCKQYALLLNGWINICSTYHVSFDLAAVNRVKVIGVLYILFLVCFRLYSHLHDYYFTDDLNEITNSIVKWSSTLITLVITSMIITFIVKIMLFRYSMEYSQKRVLEEVKCKERCLMECLEEFGRVHLAYISNFRQYEKISTPYLLICLVTMIAQIIVNSIGYFYMLNKGKLNGDMFVLGMRTMAIWITLVYTRLFGVLPLSYKCEHFPKTQRAHVQRSFLGLTCSIIWFVTLSSVTAWYIHLLTKSIHKYEAFNLLSDILFVCTGIIIIVGRIHRNSAKIGIFKTWNEFFANRGKYGLPYVLSKTNIKVLKLNAWIYVILVALCGSVVFLTLLTGSGNFPKTLVNASVIILDCSSMLNFNFDLKFLHIVFNNVKNFAIVHLDNSKKKRSLLLEIKLARVLCLYSMIHNNFLRHIKLFRFYFLFWLCLITSSTIIDLYLCVISLVYGSRGKCGLCLELRTVYITVLVIYWLHHAESLSHTNDDLLSFLFKYRISTLTREEANQVELLIKTLVIQKPVLRASDVFTVGTRLLAPSDEFLSFLFKYPISKLASDEAAQVGMLITALQIQKPVLTASDVFTLRVKLLASGRILSESEKTLQDSSPKNIINDDDDPNFGNDPGAAKVVRKRDINVIRMDSERLRRNQIQHKNKKKSGVLPKPLSVKKAFEITRIISGDCGRAGFEVCRRWHTRASLDLSKKSKKVNISLGKSIAADLIIISLADAEPKKSY
ncbi:hypothetical protein FQR65_LT01922 [Abscondita terminalis]|nr:hypothetical protein FQR65_LT01922 [Abscondita terminalis]